MTNIKLFFTYPFNHNSDRYDEASPCSDPTTNVLALNQQYRTGLSPPSNFSNGAVYEIICQIGYRWTDGLEIKLITCSGTWEYLPTCLCIFMF